MKAKYLGLMVWAMLLAGILGAQETRLAQQYFQNGEFEKAAALYQRLFEQNGSNDYFFDRYIDCLIALERYPEGEEAIRRQLRREGASVALYVTYGQLLERQLRQEEAETQFRLAIEKLPPDQYSVTRLANAFVTLTKYEQAVATYEKGAQLLQDNRIFAYNLGELYRRMGNSTKMVDSYLNALADNPDRLSQLQTIFQRYFSPDDFRELQTQLYERINTDGNATFYPELLAWVFIQRKDYRSALRQVRALDLRFRENGGRVFDLGIIAANDKDYESAIAAFDYIVDEKGLASTFYLDAKREGLRSRRLKLIEGYAFTKPELEELQQRYEQFLDEFGRSPLSASIILELAELQAIYLNNLDRAIGLLDTMVQYPNLDPIVQAQGKLSLADYYLMQGNRWDATLLYSQVDKAFKEDPLGHEARFRNARLSYYTGDFQWAQAQFEVLKASTSKLIANDALDLSVFIMDNLGLDTSATALLLYANADLLAFQNRFDESFATMDSLLAQFPDHSLQDDVLYLKANVFRKLRQFEKAAELYQLIVTNYPEDIRADNALFALAELNETLLANPEKAKELYETLFIDYSGSTFAVEARKRYRLLRGDKVQ